MTIDSINKIFKKRISITRGSPKDLLLHSQSRGTLELSCCKPKALLRYSRTRIIVLDCITQQCTVRIPVKRNLTVQHSKNKVDLTCSKGFRTALSASEPAM